MVKQIHGNQRTVTAAHGRYDKQGLFRNAPGMVSGLVFVDAEQQKSAAVHQNQINDQSERIFRIHK
jgi:hypothetical protein